MRTLDEALEDIEGKGPSGVVEVAEEVPEDLYITLEELLRMRHNEGCWHCQRYFVSQTPDGLPLGAWWGNTIYGSSSQSRTPWSASRSLRRETNVNQKRQRYQLWGRITYPGRRFMLNDTGFSSKTRLTSYGFDDFDLENEISNFDCIDQDYEDISDEKNRAMLLHKVEHARSEEVYRWAFAEYRIRMKRAGFKVPPVDLKDLCIMEGPDGEVLVFKRR